MSFMRILAAVSVAGGALAGVLVASSDRGPEPPDGADAPPITWRSIITPAALSARSTDDRTVVLDVRSAQAYNAGHIPGAINLPAGVWRTAKCAPGDGDSQFIYRKADGTPDVVRYERLLGAAGVAPDDRVVITGNHGGKADGSIPAMILDWLGHEDVAFLDGIGIDRWSAAGHALETTPSVRPATVYRANPRPGVIWTLDDVLAHLDDEGVIFLDTRSLEEFEGTERRRNRFGGRIPGAIRLDYAALLTPDRTTVDPATARALLAERRLTPDRTVVLYCQTSTRVSLPYLVLRDLGFERVAVYDASWHEYGNRADTPIEARTSDGTVARRDPSGR